MKQTKLTHRPGSQKISKLLCIAGMAAAGMTLGIAPASATITCTGSGPSPEHGTNVSGQAAFTLNTAVSPKTLTLLLKNTTTPRTTLAGDSLTGVIFNIAGNPTLAYSATTQPTLPSGSNIYTSQTTINNATLLADASGSSWTNQKAASPPVAFGYGVATTGFAGFFNGGSIGPGNAGPDYGLVAANTFPVGAFGGSQFPFIQDSLQFVFTSTATFTEADISSVSFLYGTAGGTPITTTCTIPPDLSKDFGDAPDSYKTLLASDGPRHIYTQTLKLGAVATDGEVNGQPNAGATGDDTNGTTPDDEDGIPNLPLIAEKSTSVSLSVNASNTIGAGTATLTCWIDFNKDGDFLDAGEKATTTVGQGANQTKGLIFSGFAKPLVAGDTYMRCRIANVAGEVVNPTGAANTGEVEDYKVTIKPGSGGEVTGADWGDAPNPSTADFPNPPTTSQGDYQTTLDDNGPNHKIVGTPLLYLGTVPPDDDSGLQQDVSALDDDNNGPTPPTPPVDDEEGIAPADIPTILTSDTSLKLRVKATNNSGAPAVLACWIDFNRDGDFVDTGEKAATVVSFSGTANTTLNFSTFAAPVVGKTYIRCRLTSDWYVPGDVAPYPLSTANAVSVGSPANNGEVEDYTTDTYKPCTLSQAVTSTVTLGLTPPPTMFSGARFTITSPGLPGNVDIKTLTCQKTFNVAYLASGGMVLTPNAGAVSGPVGTPPAWTITPPSNSLQVTFFRTANASATLGCTVTDSNGAVCATDPVLEQAVRLKGQPVTIQILDGGQPLSANFQYVKIENGPLGVNQFEFIVNGKKFKLNGLKDNGTYFLNIGSALRSDVDNKVTMTVKGKPDSSAIVFISDEPMQ